MSRALLLKPQMLTSLSGARYWRQVLASVAWPSPRRFQLQQPDMAAHITRAASDQGRNRG